jgi:cell division septum initiation protein DivIVA
MTRPNSETLTPERVRSAVFTPTRLGRRGVEEGEVRAFCEWVSDGLGRLRGDNAALQAEVMRLRDRVIAGKEKAGPQPEDAHIQAVYVLSKAQQTADRYVADAQEYSRELAQDAHLRRDEILREAKVRASIILEEAHTAASQAASQAASGGPAAREPLPVAERQELQAEIAYLRTFSDVCRTHLRAYMESLTRSIEQWEQVERKVAVAAVEARESGLRTPARVLVRRTKPPFCMMISTTERGLVSPIPPRTASRACRGVRPS